jgi:hypothetical protein
MQRAWTALEGHLAVGGTDYVKTLPHMEKAAMSWPAYVEKRTALETALLPDSTR